MTLRIGTLVLLAATVFCVALPAAQGREPTPLEVFARHYKDRDPRIRLKAVTQLGGERGAGVVKALLEALRDDDPRVRGRAAKLLGETRDRPDEIETLRRTGLGKQPPAVRTEAVRALARAGAPALPALRAALADRQADVRRAAALALGRARDEPSSGPLHELLRDRDRFVRAAACEAIGFLRRADAVGVAAAVLRGDAAFQPKVAAAEILGRYPAPAMVEHLKYGTLDSSWSVRVAAAEALGATRTDLASARAAAPGS